MSITVSTIRNDLNSNLLCVATTSGAIPITQGLVLLNDSSSGLEMTLAAPVPGDQLSGGQDGEELSIIVVASAPLTSPITHTVTCPSNAIEGVFSTLTFIGQSGEIAHLVAFAGAWWPRSITAAKS